MLEQLISFANDIKDHQVLPLLKRILNILFVGGITSYIFKEVYFDYQIIDILDYKRCYDFLVNGDFIVPFGIFFIIWNITTWVSFLLFKLPNFFIGIKFKNAILRFSFLKIIPNQLLIEAENNITTNESIPKNEALIRIFNLIKRSISRIDFKVLKRNIDKVQNNLEAEFTVLIRATVAITLYFINVPHFGWELLVLLYLTIMIIGFLLFIGYQLAEILPIVFNKAVSEIDKFTNAS